MEVINFNIELANKSILTLMFDTTSKIADVLKKACEKFKVNQDDYELRYGSEVLSLDTVLQNSTLPSEAHLSLIPSPRPAKVVVDLVTGGEIYSHTFRSSSTLWDVYQKLGQARRIPEESVQISFLGHGFVGKKSLKETKLSSLTRRPDKIILVLDRNWTDRKIEVQPCSSSCLTSPSLQGSSRKRGLSNVNKSKTIGEKPRIVMQMFSKKNVFNIKTDNKSSKKSEKLQQKNEDVKNIQSDKEDLAKKPLPLRKQFLKSITSVDTNYYSNDKRKVKGVFLLDGRKGLTYNLKNKNVIGKKGLTLLGLKENDKDSVSVKGEEEEISLKIVFPQQSVIQASFKPNETVGDVHSFISPLTRSSEFVLCSKDATCILDKSVILKDLDPIPEGTLLVRYTSDSWKHEPEPISEDILKPKVPKVALKKKIWKLK